MILSRNGLMGWLAILLAAIFVASLAFSVLDHAVRPKDDLLLVNNLASPVEVEIAHVPAGTVAPHGMLLLRAVVGLRSGPYIGLFAKGGGGVPAIESPAEVNSFEYAHCLRVIQVGP